MRCGREKVILGLVRGKRVLDVGCVDHDAACESRNDWLHGRIRQAAAETTGLDIAADEVAKLTETGYDILVGDAQAADLGRRFECIVAAELIEHLANPGRFLENMRKHLEPGGTLVLTTPNPFYPRRLLEVLFGGRVRINPEHVCWFCAQTLERLMRVSGFDEVDVRFYNYAARFGGIALIPSRLRRWFSTNLLVIAKNR